jgi:hypothetical protein
VMHIINEAAFRTVEGYNEHYTDESVSHLLVKVRIVDVPIFSSAPTMPTALRRRSWSIRRRA